MYTASQFEGMYVQEYTTTLDAIQNRLKNGNVNKVSIDLKGMTLNTKDADNLDVISPDLAVKVREHVHTDNWRLHGIRRNITIHDSIEVPDGTV